MDYEIIADGGSKGNPGRGYGSYQIRSSITGKEVLHRLDFGDNVTNNEAEYRAVIDALVCLGTLILKSRRSIKNHSVLIQTDSNLVVNQVLGIWKVRDPDLVKYCTMARELLNAFGQHEISWIPRERVETVLGH